MQRSSSVQDADKLDAIGAFGKNAFQRAISCCLLLLRTVSTDCLNLVLLRFPGIMRCAAYSGYKNRPLYDPAEKAQLNMTYEQYQTQTKANTGCAISHFHEKLFRLKDMMKTPTGIKMAQKRHDVMVTFVQQIEEEYSMDE